MSVTVLLCGVTARAYVLCVRLRYNVWRYGSPLTPCYLYSVFGVRYTSACVVQVQSAIVIPKMIFGPP